jgi:hypothetical protein
LWRVSKGGGLGEKMVLGSSGRVVADDKDIYWINGKDIQRTQK